MREEKPTMPENAEPPGTFTAHADVLRVVREVLSAYTKQPRLHTAPPEDVSLQSLEIASVDMIGVVIELEGRFGCAIDESRIHELWTIADLTLALAESCRLVS